MNTIISVNRFILMFSQVEDREPGTEEKPGKKRRNQNDSCKREPAELLASQLTENTALIAVNGSGSGDVFFHNVKAHNRRVGAFGKLANAEEYLPRQQVGEQRVRRRKQRVLREKGANVGTKGTAGEVLRLGEGRRRERKEVVEIGGDSLLRGAFEALPSAHNHHGGGNRRVVQLSRRVGRDLEGGGRKVVDRVGRREIRRRSLAVDRERKRGRK
ncbi:hypothetical protein V8G54_027906 [Vigna mungo]|uniref:Uncharacterized protein n=1 Tax=Vigna mungo TaxID=3915 RepID=A0AAQ3RL75_VIGMU